MRIGVIGYGYWGPQLVRNFRALKEANVVVVCDQRPEKLAEAALLHGSLQTTRDPEDLFRDPSLDAVAIATPVDTHFELARRALHSGKHVWVEKPMTATIEQATQLVDEARRAGRIVFVDHTFLYTAAVRKIHELITQNKLGDLYYYDSVRLNLGIFQHDVNVIWDLAVHDLAIIDYLFRDKPVAVSATGIAHFAGQAENVAYVTLFFPGRQIAHIHANWLSPVKVRQTLIGGSEKMILWDDLEPSEKIKVYDKGIMIQQTDESRVEKLIGYRTGDMWAPHLDRTEALQTAARDFARCIREGTTPITDGAFGLRIVKILDAASRSLQLRGQQVAL
jgi:predicted dehydrogenase